MKITEKIVDITTGEETIIERDETANEKIARESYEAELAKKEAEAEEKVTARATILDRLGLTVDEAAILLG
jgi:uncharacterized membrane protein